MCGILGQINLSSPINPHTFETMCATLAHRGPDAQVVKFFDAPPVALGHRRLSIIDLSDAARQPMSNEDGSLWLTLNGEIYNFAALRGELQKVGHRFKSNSDSEVVLHAYEEWGRGCLDRLRGIFAFGVLDRRESRLFLARDPIGVKPLYYYLDETSLVFASEIKAILADPSLPRALRLDALSDYLAYGYVPHDRSIFQNIYKLPAGHFLTYSDGKIQIQRYWHLDYSGEINDASEAIELLQAALEEAVQLQLVSDVPVGVFLSGGVDSSAVTALMSDHYPGNTDTFTIGFEGEEFDETPYARRISSYLNTNHHEQKLSYDAAREQIPLFPEIYDEPFYDSSGMPTYLVAQLARSRVKVVLGGDGGDEIFAGYQSYDRFIDQVGASVPHPITRAGARLLFPPLRRLRRTFPQFSPLAKSVRQRIREPLASHFRTVCFLDGAAQRRLLHPSAASQLSLDTLWLFRKFWREDYPRLSAVQYLDFHTYLVDDILTKVDRAGMAHGLEVRVPLLDQKLVELAFKISPDLHYAGGERKALFKKAVAGRLPEDILSTRKMGFSVPMEDWLAQGLGESAQHLLRDGSLVSRQIIDPQAVTKFLLSANFKFTWLLLELELWARHWLEGQSLEF
jgi:asparagine synthase (glutamine-hydrolysing)